MAPSYTDLSKHFNKHFSLRWTLNHTNLSRTEFVLKTSIKQIRIYRVDVEQTGWQQPQGVTVLGKAGNHGGLE